MSIQQEPYTGYQTTDFIREKAGFKGQANIKDSEINQAIKAAEEKINDDTGLFWMPYNLSIISPPFLIKEITKFFAIAFLREVYPDDEDTGDKNFNLGMKLLEKFILTNTPAQAAAAGGGGILSYYNADTNDPNIEPDLTSRNFNRDYLPTYVR